jgi:holo-[acyl-carrier protein] synthase
VIRPESTEPGIAGPERAGPASTGAPEIRPTATGPPAPGPATALSLPLAIAAMADIPLPADPVWRHWLTAAELAYCGSLQHVSDHLAVRALAKRVVAEVLAWPGEIPWQEVQILRRPAGGPVVELADRPDRWRRQQGLPVPGVSLTHAAGHAAAIAWLPGKSGRSGT